MEVMGQFELEIDVLIIFNVMDHNTTWYPMENRGSIDMCMDMQELMWYESEDCLSNKMNLSIPKGDDNHWL